MMDIFRTSLQHCFKEIFLKVKVRQIDNVFEILTALEAANSKVAAVVSANSRIRHATILVRGRDTTERGALGVRGWNCHVVRGRGRRETLARTHEFVQSRRPLNRTVCLFHL